MIIFRNCSKTSDTPAKCGTLSSRAQVGSGQSYFQPAGPAAEYRCEENGTERGPAATTVSVLQPRVRGNKERELRLEAGWGHRKAEHEAMNNSRKAGGLRLRAEMNGILTDRQVGKLSRGP